MPALTREQRLKNSQVAFETPGVGAHEVRTNLVLPKPSAYVMSPEKSTKSRILPTKQNTQNLTKSKRTKSSPNIYSANHPSKLNYKSETDFMSGTEGVKEVNIDGK